MKPLKTDFVQAFMRMGHDGWLQGWHERNGGNASYRMSRAEVAQIKTTCKPKSWHDLSDVSVPDLAGEHFLITAAGSFFRNMQLFPKESFGIIEIDNTGRRYRQCWGFAHGKKGGCTSASGCPTSELPSHLLIHQAKKRATDGASRVVYHAHPAHIAALTFVLSIDAQALTQTLWQMISECAMVFPQGVGVVPWMVPGSVELGRATALQMEERDAVVWPHHGLICAGETFDLTFGLMHTIEKAAEVYTLARSMQGTPDGFAQHITDDDLRALSSAYDLRLQL